MKRAPIESSTSRTVTHGGRERLSFAGCDYLGLGHHPEVIDATQAVLRSSGVSSAASRTTSGTHIEHERLELALARFLGTESATLAPDGYIADVVAAAAIRTISNGAPVPLLERDSHPSLIDAVQLADFGEPASSTTDARPKLHVCEGVHPMEGRLTPLDRIVAALGPEDYVLLDDCHGFGVLGDTGRGTLEAFDLDDDRVVLTSSLAKALGCAGGFVAGSAKIVDAARGTAAWIGTTPIPPALAAAARTALGILDREPQRVEHVKSLSRRLRSICVDLGFERNDLVHPVCALRFPSDEEGRRAESTLDDLGIRVPFVHYLEDSGALRISLSAAHTDADLDRLADALRTLR